MNAEMHVQAQNSPIYFVPSYFLGPTLGSDVHPQTILS
jgi:hypothetical protein